MNKKNIILTAVGSEYAHALTICESYGLSAGHLCYGITPAGQLLREKIPTFARDGVMILSDSFGCTGMRSTFNAERLAGEIIAEVTYRGFTGVMADFEGPILPSLISLIRSLDKELEKRGITLYVNHRYAEDTTHASLLVSSRVTGGSFPLYLQELCDKYTPGRIALDSIRTWDQNFIFTLSRRSILSIGDHSCVGRKRNV